MVNTAEKRRAIEDAYPGIDWKLRVAAMSEAQVHVVYTRIFVEKKH
jgi:hypothetical protein